MLDSTASGGASLRVRIGIDAYASRLPTIDRRGLYELRPRGRHRVVRALGRLEGQRGDGGGAA
ncbi:hypothetical protein BOSE62_30214 [Bosea sp. 62]|nr:hypothetical protein BOSE21B_111412 [Bosea sp. 21B]CAD5270598.1 hypothetical protein BOSE7B_20227 [Bosea sp. 7B]VVT62358.1 hypothetical protein BOS5A_80018 [Bosea sp. EC-HK365B]VXC14022.1 hypothetical protein BOSE62_30214 [Bosea sp. 62]VXC66423.1 hypothetical protein BOSE127_30243 [Bosea sp. 127]